MKYVSTLLWFGGVAVASLHALASDHPSTAQMALILGSVIGLIGALLKQPPVMLDALPWKNTIARVAILMGMLGASLPNTPNMHVVSVIFATFSAYVHSVPV